MATIPYQRFFTGIDVDSVCRNWEANHAGTLVPHACKAEALRTLVSGINHLCGSYFPMLWCSAWSNLTYDNSLPSSNNPHHAMALSEAPFNMRTRTFNTLFLPPVVGDVTDAQYFQRTTWSGAGWALDSGTIGQENHSTGTVAAPVFPRSIVSDAATFTRVDVTAKEEGISTFGSYGLLDCYLVGSPPAALETSVHRFCGGADGLVPGNDIIESTIEEIRSKLASIRDDHQFTVGCWSSIGVSRTVADPGDGAIHEHATGIWCSTTTLTNILDQASTSRTATTPGISAHLAYAGVGPIGQTAGRKVPLLCMAFITSNGDGTVRFQGSDTFTNNYTDIAVTSGTDWYGVAGNIIYGDSGAADDDATTARNKIDVLASVAAANIDMKIYAIHVRTNWNFV